MLRSVVRGRRPLRCLNARFYSKPTGPQVGSSSSSADAGGATAAIAREALPPRGC